MLWALTSNAEPPSIIFGFLCSSLSDGETGLQEVFCAKDLWNSYVPAGKMFVLINKTTDFCGEGLLPSELRWNKFIFKSWATWTAQCQRITAARLDCSRCPCSGSYFMFAKTRLWSACIKLLSIQGWIIYLHRPIFSPSWTHCFSGSVPVTHTVQEQWG